MGDRTSILVECQDCHRQISPSARVCPGCGAPRGKKHLPPGETLRNALIAVGIGSALIVAQQSLTGGPHRAAPTSPPPVQRDYEAQAQCRMFIRRALKAPSTADFPWFRSSVIRDGDAYVVVQDVDAENSFGAKLRARYRCRVKPNGDAWVLVALDEVGG